MDVVLEHLTDGRDLKAVIDVARCVSYPPDETLDCHAGRAAEWLVPVASGDVPDSLELRDIAGSFVSLCRKMTNLRPLYQLNANGYLHKELWNALDGVRYRFDPGRIGYWSDHMFDDFPDGGFRDTPGYRKMSYKRLAVLQQKEMALE